VVAAKAKISREYLNRIENGHLQPTVPVFMRVCRAIGVRGSEVLRQIEQ
jgi:transcriptional regulator with XRE-family HTH domain